MEPLKDTIHEVMQKLKPRKVSATREEPFFVLQRILGRRESAHISLRYFRDGVLNIGVDSSTRLYNLTLKKEELLMKIRQKTNTVIKDIRFYLGEIR